MQELMGNLSVFDVNVGTLKPYRDAYYFIALNDASAFHQFLANAALLRALHMSKVGTLRSHESIASHCKALQLANRKIANGEEGVSESMIATVLMMAAYNVSTVQFLLIKLKSNIFRSSTSC